MVCVMPPSCSRMASMAWAQAWVLGELHDHQHVERTHSQIYLVKRAAVFDSINLRVSGAPWLMASLTDPGSAGSLPDMLTMLM